VKGASGHHSSFGAAAGVGVVERSDRDPGIHP